MGWYTELKIGNQHFWSWRKHLPIEAPLLFYGKHRSINTDTEYDIEADVFVGLEATAGQVISNLDQLGLTLEFFTSIYATFRSGLIGWGLARFQGMKVVYEHIKNDSSSRKMIRDINGWIDKVTKGNPSNDIKCAIELVKSDIKLESDYPEDES